MIVGTIAPADWCGPYVLNGRRTATGTSNVRWKLSISLSAATLLAAYGDCGSNGWSSVIGTVCAEPYTSLVDVWITRATPAASEAWATLSDPSALTSKKSRGLTYEYGIAIWAPRWNTISTPATARDTDSMSRSSPATTSTSETAAGSSQ